jgi:hypothetical protein
MTRLLLPVAWALFCGAVGCDRSSSSTKSEAASTEPRLEDADDDGYSEADTDTDTDTDSDTDTDTQLARFYETYGGRDAFPTEHVLALESFLAAEDAVEMGNLVDAGALVEQPFATWPRGDARWYVAGDGGTGGSNVGHPPAYYGLRMLEQVVALDGSTATGTLQMTAVVAPCATVRRPVYPGEGAEVVELDIHPDILADDAHRLHLATALFRRWVQAVTGGLEVDLVVHTLSTCTTVDFTDDGSVVVSYPDAASMIAAVPADIARGTDFWWVVAPSGVPGTGAGTGRHFITGGMSSHGAGLPLFLSDDLWFVRKPEHMGTGDWTEIEVRAYHPQWFQHEFMHHLFRTWPEHGLEDSDHQWFDRATWPDDFEGTFEADYYAEAITKRLLDSGPSLADGLSAAELVDPTDLPLSVFEGDYARQPVENDWQEVSVTVAGGALRWTNQAGVSWGLEVRDGGLFTMSDCPYGVSEVAVEVAGDAVVALWFGSEAYRRTEG